MERTRQSKDGIQKFVADAETFIGNSQKSKSHALRNTLLVVGTAVILSGATYGILAYEKAHLLDDIGAGYHLGPL